MSRVALHRKIRGELELLEAQHLITVEQGDKLRERYPTEPWDLASLARWLTLFGAVATGGGVVLLASKLEVWRSLLEAALLAAAGGLLWLARWLGTTRKLVRTQAALELLASFALQALTAALAVHYSRDSKNWPALIGVGAALAGALAYILGNRLVLIHALINFFVFFGGETGYVSGWGVYWLGMNYPLRFLGAGLASVAVAWFHANLKRENWRAFSRVYLHFGLLISHFALWFFSVFGYFEEHVSWSDKSGERVAFSLLWAAASIASGWWGARRGLSTLRAYGLTFLLIDVYTFYFQFIVAKSFEAWFVHLLVVGGSLVFLALRVERLRRIQ